MKTTYKVMAGTFLGHQAGEEFEADLDPVFAKRAVERGQISVVGKGDPKPKKEKTDG